MRMTTNANRRVTDEQIERARSIDLVQFLQQYEPPGELKRIGQSWTLKSHDSMRISADGRWNWFSQNKGGGDAIGFLQAVHGMSFQDAVRTLAGEDFKTIPATQAEHKAKPPERTAFALPPKNNGNRRVFAYLHRSRGIAAEIINHCIKNNLLYEDAQHHNAVFVGKDETGTAKYAFLRGTLTGSHFRQEATGSDKSYGFFLRGSGKTLFVCEAAIDALSIATLRKFEGLDWKKDNYLALGGVTASESKLPAALERTLNTFSFKRVVLCFDNDAAGQTAARRIFTMLRQRFPENLEVRTCVPKVKDFNDQLCVKLQNGKNSPSRGMRESTLSR